MFADFDKIMLCTTTFKASGGGKSIGTGHFVSDTLKENYSLNTLE